MNLSFPSKVSKYGKDGCKLYPSDVETRAKIDDVLYFDATSFYDAFGKTCVGYLKICTLYRVTHLVG